jgi:glycosyltransferase involved in cell wall biosynthesis
VLCSPEISRRFSLPISPKINEIQLPDAESFRFYRLWWLQYRLAERLEKMHADVSLSLSGMGRADRGRPHIVLIQQSLPFSREALETLDVSERLRMKAVSWAMRRSCLSSSAVFVQTETMKKIVSAALSLSPEAIRVFPPAVAEMGQLGSPSPSLRSMWAAEAGFRLLYVGSQARYKNLSVLVEAVGSLKQRLPALRIFLASLSEGVDRFTGNIEKLGYLQGPELAEAYSLADMLIMPSLQETVGLPMLEAMSAGVPVLAADRPYAHEICEDAACFFDPLDPGDLAQGILRLLTNDRLRTEQILRGRAIAERRRQMRPYKRMLDIVATVAASEVSTVPVNPH